MKRSFRMFYIETSTLTFQAFSFTFLISINDCVPLILRFVTNIEVIPYFPLIITDFCAAVSFRDGLKYLESSNT